jgi:hypothetical protein
MGSRLSQAARESVDSISALAGPPVLGREPLKSFQVPLIQHSRHPIVILHQLVKVLREDRPDGVDGVVPSETFTAETGQGLHHHLVAESNLVFDDDVNNGVKLQIGQSDLPAPMVVRYQLHPFAFVGMEPIRW